MTKVKSVRGMNDIKPEEVGLWQYLESNLREVFASYGYDEIRFPLVEQTDLFSRSVGESSDIVNKEMYTFEDKGGDLLSLRPEGTAGCVRACLENDLLRVDTPKLWYIGPMFRYERPQKGRSRQFHQASAEVFGIDSHTADAELIMLSRNLWKKLEVEDKLNLEINSLGNSETRERYKTHLNDFFKPFLKDLEEDSLRQLKQNPLRILDSKLDSVKDMLIDAPSIVDCLDKESEDHFNKLLQHLSDSGIKFVINNQLVRGLDYYNKTVFEWKSKEIGSKDTVCGGGRYDGLVSQLGGKDCPAIGFSIGMERLILLLSDSSKLDSSFTSSIDCSFICLTAESIPYALKKAEKIREKIPSLNLKVNLEASSASSQFKRADKSGANLALIVGEGELKDNTISIKDLRGDKAQETLDLDQLINKLSEIYS
tara:strand:- start:33492 stop:34769 length:1278 start_codon:yes stop_codon:yes gene_type:complete